MTVESASYISQLNTSYPAGADAKSEGDDHLRLIKSVLTGSFPNIAGPVSASHSELNLLIGLSETVQSTLSQLSLSISSINTELGTISASLSSINTGLNTLSNSISSVYVLLDSHSQSLSQINVSLNTLSTSIAGINRYIVRAYLSASQNISATGSSTVTFDTKDFNVGSAYDATTGRFLPASAGYYKFRSKMFITGGAGTVRIKKTDTPIDAVISSSGSILFQGITYLDGSADAINVVVHNNDGGTSLTYSISAGQFVSFIEINGPI